MSQTPPQGTPDGSGRGPGRRPPGVSRARTGGSARPLPDGAEPGSGRGSARRPPSFAPQSRPGSGPVRRSTREAGGASGGGLPPSIPPAGAGGQPAPDRTRVMPADHPARQAGAYPGGPAAPPAVPPSSAPPVHEYEQAPPPRPRRRRRRGRGVLVALVLLLVLVLAWPVGLLIWANGKIQHVDAGEGSVTSPGTTYLLAGSDSRADDEDFANDPTEGQRADTIMILTVPPSGTTSLISLPRDTYTEIPGHGWNKLNAAYAWGGPELLRASVEGLTGIEVDHYVEIGMGGLANVVDAVGGVELCLDYDVSDADSRLEWEAGCHVADGATALAFARMRAADPLGDIGRTQRQQQVIQAVTRAVADPGLAVRPGAQVELLDAGLGALQVSEGSNIVDLGRMALAFRTATGPDGVRGAPPIASLDYRPGGVGSTVLLEDHYPAFFASVADGTVTQADTYNSD